MTSFFDNSHFERLFDDIVRTGIYTEIDTYIEMCEHNAEKASNPCAWLERADQYRQLKDEARLQRAVLLARENGDDITQ